MPTREIRGNGDRAEPSPEEPARTPTGPAPAVPGAGVPRGPVRPGRVGMPGAVARLARLVRRAAARIGAGQADAYELAAREAFHSAVIQGSSEPLAPAAPRLATAPAAEPEPATTRAELAPAISAAAEPPAERVAAAGPAWPPAPAAPVRGRRRQAGDTAPDHLLRTPGSVDQAADDFFGGLVRRVDGDR